MLSPYLRQGGPAAVLAEEWHSVNAVLHLDWLLRGMGMRDRVSILWNANNTFCFENIDWPRLAQAAVITTVSRYMKLLMQGFGVESYVIPNGLSSDALLPPKREAVEDFRALLLGRTVVCKVARWDPDKRWLAAVEIVRCLKLRGWKPLLIARGGIEPHGAEVLGAAVRSGLRVIERKTDQPGVRGLLRALRCLEKADVVSLLSPVDSASRRVLFGGSAVVLANSSHEPFGLVGLEAMAARGVVCTGCTGEDYAMPGQNALVLETSDPWEFLSLFEGLHAHPAQERALRRAGRSTARRYAWSQITEQVLLPRLRLVSASATRPVERVGSKATADWVPSTAPI